MFGSYGGIDLFGGDLANAVLPLAPTTGSYVGQICRNAAYIAVIWNGSQWVTPISSGSLPTGTTDSMLKYNTTTNVWENAPYLTYSGTRLRTSVSGSTTQYAELFSASTMQIGLRLQASTSRYININSAASFPLMDMVGSTTTDYYAVKVGNGSVSYFTVTNQGNVVAKTLKLSGLGTSSVGEFAGIDAGNSVTKLSQAAALAALGLSETVKLDSRTLFVSPEFPIPNTDAKHFQTISEAIAWTYTFNNAVLWDIVILAGTYSESFKLMPNVTLICADHVRFTGCDITVVQGAKFLGNASVEIGNQGVISVVSEVSGNAALTIVEGNELAIRTVGVPLHIRCNTLTEFVATVNNDYCIAPYISKLDVRIECLNICRVVTTGVPFSLLATLRAMPFITNNLYCQCEWDSGEPKCRQSSQCLMRWMDIPESLYRTTEDSRVTIRTNTRDPYSEFLIAVGKVSVFGLVHDSVIETPANYITSATYSSEDTPRTQLNIHGFRGNYASLGTAYQVANEGTLTIDSCNIRATNGGARVVYQKIDGTNYTCRTSVKNSYLEGGAYDIQSATTDRLAIVASWGCIGEVGSTTILGAWYTGVGINWI